MPESSTRAAPMRRLAAVLFADIVGFTMLTAEDDARAFQLAAALQECARRCIAREGGRVVRFVGDSVLAEFPSAESAVRAAFALEREYEDASALEGVPGMLHIGVHVGELTEAPDGDIYGDSVNIAARLQAEAAPRQVLVSEDVWRQLRGRREFLFEPAGLRRLKGIAEAVTVHAVRPRDARATDARTPPPDAAPISAVRAELAPTRLIVLPFRLLRPDPEIEFLSFGLADAITATLSGLRSLVVRSSLAALRYGGDAPDLQAIGRDADVDLVLTGTLLRAGDRVRVTAQLTDVATGTVLWSESQQVALGDLFQLQDDLTSRVVQSVATPLTARERRMIRRDVPATARAYELYLRGNQIGAEMGDWRIARDLYLAALEEDPEYAPAWAQLGRCYRLLAKYSADPDPANRETPAAEAAFEKALELNPDLPLAHSLYAQHEVERGRPRDGMVRLLDRARTSRDAQIFAGLVHALRYCGLVHEAIAAHHRARQVDPNVPTSIEYCWLLTGEFERSVALPDGNTRTIALTKLGRIEEAKAWQRSRIERFAGAVAISMMPFVQAELAALDGDRDRVIEYLTPIIQSFPDKEGIFACAQWLAYVNAVDECVAVLANVVDGFYCDEVLRTDEWFEAVRAHPDFPAILERAAAGRERALTTFLELDGPELLDIGLASAAAASAGTTTSSRLSPPSGPRPA